MYVIGFYDNLAVGVLLTNNFGFPYQFIDLGNINSNKNLKLY